MTRFRTRYTADGFAMLEAIYESPMVEIYAKERAEEDLKVRMTTIARAAIASGAQRLARRRS